MEKIEYKDDYYEDRINLYYYIQVIWRWKFIIVGIVILSVIVALLMSFRITPVYRVSASFSPGETEEIDMETGKVEVVPVDLIENIVGFINGGTYNPMIINSLNFNPNGLQFQADHPGGAYIIKVIYDTTDPAQGNVIVGELLNQIENSYSWKITLKIDRFKEALSEYVFLIEKIKLLKDTERKITRQIKMVDDNTESIIKQRDRLLSESGGGDTVALLLYLNTIQANIAYKDTLNKDLQIIRGEHVDKQNEIESSERFLNNQFLIIEKLVIKGDMTHYFSELISKYYPLLEENPSIINLGEKLNKAQIEVEASDIEMIRVVQEPFVSSKPIEPKRTRMVLIYMVFSLFLGIFLALIIDFIKKSKTSLNQD